MEVVRGLAQAERAPNTILTIGSFDGFHRGHQRLVARVVERARELGGRSALLTFDPHPRQVLGDGNKFSLLTPLEEKIELLENSGLELLVVEEFSRELADRPAREFLAQVMEGLGVVELWCGPNFGLGRRREAGLAEIRALGKELGFRVRVLEPFSWNGRVVSSSFIRELLSQGEVAQAAELLGRLPSLEGQVVAGEARGRELGFPTANILPPKGRLLPGDGVYAVWVRLSDGRRYPGVADLGLRPSFGGKERRLEVHLLDFEGELYGQELKVEFVQRLRGEKCFASARELSDQVKQDMHRSRELLAELKEKEDRGEEIRGTGAYR